jgi:formylglycine-generating enzyme required for sulfatase activity
MRNFVIGCIVLFTTAGTVFSEGPKQPPKKLTMDFGKGVKLEMVLIQAGEFLMGSPDSDKDAFPWEASSYCRRRHNGNMPAVRGPRRGIALGMMSRSWAIMRGTRRTRAARPIL